MNADLLHDEILRYESTSGQHLTVSLPSLLAALGAGQVRNYLGVQRHQLDAFHVFLTYLAGAALDQANTTDLAQPETFWKDWLQQLATPFEQDAWRLIVNDPTRPAFMQPPVQSDEQFSKFKVKAATPDNLDVLQTAKNHDVKSNRMSGASPEAWVLSLISTQTMSGFLGQGNYGICRMNGGFASRPVVSVNTSLSASSRFLEDLGRLLTHRNELLSPPWLYRADGHRLLWLVPWDASAGLALDSLHPFFIEVCRLIRLVESEGQILAMGMPSRAARITVAKNTAGNVGDPWIPIKRTNNSALTIPAGGFSPSRLRDLIITHDEFIPAPMQSFSADDRPAWFRASVLVRGQGTTDGFHEARIYITPRVKRLLASGGAERDRLGALSEWALTRAKDVRNKCLRPAIHSLLGGGPDGWPDTTRHEAMQWVSRWMARYDQQWSIEYFPWIWGTLDTGDREAKNQWLGRLRSLAETILETSLTSAPQRSGRRYRGRVRATGLFHGRFHKNFSEELKDAA